MSEGHFFNFMSYADGAQEGFQGEPLLWITSPTNRTLGLAHAGSNRQRWARIRLSLSCKFRSGASRHKMSVCPVKPSIPHVKPLETYDLSSFG